MKEITQEKVRAKIEAKKKLTKDERLWRLMNVRGHTEHDARVIMEINDNKNKNVLID